VAETSIEWASHVYNPFTGCDRVTPGCAHCYALTMAKRLQAMGNVRYQNDGDSKASGPGFGFTVHWDKLENPPQFPAGARVFVNSMSDVFHEQAPDGAVGQLINVMALQPDVDFLVLTKRPERMRDLVTRWYSGGLDGYGNPSRELGTVERPVRNVWLGVTIENRRFVHRADLLRETPAAVRFISAEPLLGPLVPPVAHGTDAWRGCRLPWLARRQGRHHTPPARPHLDRLADRRRRVRPRRTPLRPRTGSATCATPALHSGTAFFLKQLGGHPDKRGHEKALLDGAGQPCPPEIVWSPDNALVLCAEPAPNRCHNRHTLAFRRIPQSALRPENWRFACELDLEWVLRTEYPS
jgi:protein gp37